MGDGIQSGTQLARNNYQKVLKSLISTLNSCSIIFALIPLLYHTHVREIRLEAATSRLEDIAEAQASGRLAPTNAAVAAQPNTSATPTTSAPPPPAEDPAVVQAYDADVNPYLETFVKLSGELSPILKEQVSVS